MSDAPGDKQPPQGTVERAVGTSVLGNSTAFGFSIVITISYGALQDLHGAPTLLELLLYGAAAVVALAVMQGIITRGFRVGVERLPVEVSMLGTAQNVVSVVASVGAVIGLGELIGGPVVWPLAGALAATVFVALESAELLLAVLVQRARGDREV